MSKWYFCLDHHKVEPQQGCKPSQRLGPYDSVSLGKILNEAIRNEALTDGAWWAFAPAMALITSIAFSLYVLNTSMEEVFNPRLRK